MLISEIIEALEQWAPPALQEHYDNSGLLVGEKKNAVTGCLVTLDVTEAVVDEAITNGANLIIAHHPVVFSGLKKLNGTDPVQRTVIQAIKNDIAIYALHTNLDNVLSGVNQKIGQLLGLVGLRILEPKPQQLVQLTVFAPPEVSDRVKTAMWEAGAGQIGNYRNCAFISQGQGSFMPTEGAQPAIGEMHRLTVLGEDKIEVCLPKWRVGAVLEAAKQSHIYEELAYYIVNLENQTSDYGSGMIGQWQEPKTIDESLALIKKVFGGTIRYTAPIERPIERVAFCGGSGSFLLGQAKAQKADLFLTADFKYHQFFDADGRLVIADIGHFEIEQFTSQLIVDHLKQKFTTFAPQISAVNTNPVGYY